MPASAIATGVVDIVAPVQDIPAKLADYLESFDSLPQILADRAEGRRKTGATSVRRDVCRILLDQVGHDFGGYKERTFLRRVQRRMQVLQISELADYLERLQQDKAEVAQLFRDLLIGVTGFFRDEDAFRAIEQRVIPELLGGKTAGDGLRIWVAGCSTGEEVYSLAILVHERIEMTRAELKVQIFGTDIDESRHCRSPVRPAIPPPCSRRWSRRDCSASSSPTAARSCSPSRCGTCACSPRTASSATRPSRGST